MAIKVSEIISEVRINLEDTDMKQWNDSILCFWLKEKGDFFVNHFQDKYLDGSLVLFSTPSTSVIGQQLYDLDTDFAKERRVIYGTSSPIICSKTNYEQQFVSSFYVGSPTASSPAYFIFGMKIGILPTPTSVQAIKVLGYKKTVITEPVTADTVINFDLLLKEVFVLGVTCMAAEQDKSRHPSYPQWSNKYNALVNLYMGFNQQQAQ